jgi:hypothetical protein
MSLTVKLQTEQPDRQGPCELDGSPCAVEAPKHDAAVGQDIRDVRANDVEFLERESREHGGQVVARFPDGENVYARSYAELYDILDARGVEYMPLRLEHVSSLEAFDI